MAAEAATHDNYPQASAQSAAPEVPSSPPAPAADTPAPPIEAAQAKPHTQEVSTEPSTEPPPLPHLFAELTTGDRIFQQLPSRDRTFLIALGILVFLSLSGVVSTLDLDSGAPPRPPVKREGQVETDNGVTVELVEAPDANSQSKRAQIGEKVPPLPPPTEPLTEPTPSQPEQKPQEAQKPQKPAPQPPEKKPPETVEQPKKPPPVQYDLEAATDTVKEKPNPDAAEPRESQEARDPSQPKPPPVVASQQLGAAPKGTQSAYSKAVLSTLAKSKPQLWVRKADVRLQFNVNAAGEPVGIVVLQSSNDAVFDDVVVSWVKRSRFDPPPPDAKPEDRSFLIHYSVN